MANDPAETTAPAVLEQPPVYPYPFPLPPGTYSPPFFISAPPADPKNPPTNPKASGEPGNPYMFPYPPPGMFYIFPPVASRPQGTPAQAPAPAQSQAQSQPQPQPQPNSSDSDLKNVGGENGLHKLRAGVQALRRVRKKGLRRGPYKRRGRDGDSPPAAEPFITAPAAASESTSPSPSEWIAVGGPSTAAAASVLSATPFPVPPEGCSQPFYTPTGFVLAPPQPGAGEGTPPIPYFYPYPPFGTYPSPLQPAALTTGGLETNANGVAAAADGDNGDDKDAEGEDEVEATG
ncbi:hypothetical protein B0H17DRAFT_1327710 [Mycena rosella]|uniref:Uncharacterized protein n=1 Tax=Mycena rosella TaxID=1033263 RepID=A0AAD7DW65_MYCRO|nr:hypothetical protein B0H17DRAFT_1327710 [Mycena rosella]